MNSETYIVIYVALGKIIDVVWAGNKIRAKGLAKEREEWARSHKYHSDDYVIEVYRLTGTPPKCEEIYDWQAD